MDFAAHRPPSVEGQGDAYLPPLIKELTRLLQKTQKKLTYDTLRLPGREIGNLAHVLVEFGEDLHNDIGLWRSLEQYNRDFFNTPLPLILPAGEAGGRSPSLEERLCHLLWVLYGEIQPDLILSPAHQDLRRLAAVVADFLNARLAKVPRQSGVKRFLAQPNKFGWEVKRKLVWLGWHSYLFRYHCQNYVEAHGGAPDIPVIDDFICQETTTWSGLGVIDILAATLSLNQSQRATLRSWYERHAAYYRVVASRGARLRLINLVNKRPYSVRMDVQTNIFKKGQIVFGSLTPWEGNWYWSGEQRTFGDAPAETLQNVVNEFKQKAAQVVYRYDKTLLEHANETANRMHQQFLNYHGDDLVIYPDGRSMAADMQKMYRQYNETIIKQRPQPPADWPASPPLDAPYPPEVTGNDNGLAVFSNPGEGIELIINFNDVVSGLEQRGQDLSEDEADAIQGFIESDAISPQFVRRVTREYGDESIAAAFLIRQPQDKTCLDYLLRRYKGHFYRNRYPQVTVI